jgi:glycosyltransferase involved in cell wall biosynthesis
MDDLVSVIIPNYNGGKTIGKCLEATLASRHPNFEVIVVDDHSQDNSVEIISQYPCKLVRLDRHRGAAAARNMGVRHGRGGTLFFTDADCLLQDDALALAAESLAAEGPSAIVGGTYTLTPYDRRFCSRFQSVFINFFETRHAPGADYVATHALAMNAEVFRGSRGFAEDGMPILEDVEFSHRMRRAGCRLVMNPAIQVRHVFDYSLSRSLRNAFVKAKFWTCYAIRNRDLLADSGTASRGLKVNAGAWVLTGLMLLAHAANGPAAFMAAVPWILAFNLYVNRALLFAFGRAEGATFAMLATLYYVLLYPPAVVAGALAGTALHMRSLAPAGGPR